MTRLAFTSYQEYRSHWLFRAIRKTAMRKSGGRCVQCGAPATEVHHWRKKRGGKFQYPEPWGAFDVPYNIQPLCHACHCKEHGETK